MCTSLNEQAQRINASVAQARDSQTWLKEREDKLDSLSFHVSSAKQFMLQQQGWFRTKRVCESFACLLHIIIFYVQETTKDLKMQTTIVAEADTVLSKGIRWLCYLCLKILEKSWIAI